MLVKTKCYVETPRTLKLSVSLLYYYNYLKRSQKLQDMNKEIGERFLIIAKPQY